MKYRAPLSLAAYLGCIREASRKVASATRMLRRPRFSDGGSIRNVQVYQIEPGTIHQGRAGYIVLQAPMEMERYGFLKSRRGPELVEPLKSRHANVAVPYMSGIGEDGLRPDEASALSGRFIQKLFRKGTLLRQFAQSIAVTILTEKFVMRAPSYVQLRSDENGAKLRLR
jgi:hypothetical protein